MTRAMLLRWLLACLLVIGQQVGLCHAASHAPGHGPTHQHQKGVKLLVCDECLAAAHLEPGPGAATHAPAAAVHPVSPEVGTSPVSGTAAVPGFLSGAPPPLLRLS